MRRFVKGAIAASALCGLAGGATAKEPPLKAPVTVELANGCAQELGLKLGAVEAKVAAGTKSGAQTITPSGDQGYELHLLGGKEPMNLGLVALTPGGSYTIRVADCRAGAADVYVDDLTPLPPEKSPHAAAELRFRARQNLHLEYKAGAGGRFTPLSVAMTSYKEIPGGKTEVTLRLKAGKAGPVVKMFRKELDLKPGHRYLIEANVVGNEILFKQEDEGLTGT